MSYQDQLTTIAAAIDASLAQAIAVGAAADAEIASLQPAAPRTIYSDPSKMIAGKGYFDPTGATAVVSDAECSNMGNTGHNGAAIWQDCDALTVSNLWAHDGEQGILAGAKTSLDVSRSRFERLGSNQGSGIAHGLYSTCATNAISNSACYWPKQQAHLVKLRGPGTHSLDGVILAQLEGWGSRCLDVTDGGDCVIDRAVFQIGPKSDGGWDVIGWGLEVPANVRSLTIKRAIAISDWGSPTTRFINAKGMGTISIENLTLVGNFDPNNMIVNPDGASVTIGTVTRFATRADAGYPDYNGTEACIPWPAEWGTRPGLWDEATVIPTGPASVSLTTPVSVQSGASAMISWNAANALAVEFEGSPLGYGPASGTKTLPALTAPTTVSLRAIGGSSLSDVVSKTIDVTPAGAFDPASLVPGWNEIPNTKMSSVIPPKAGIEATVWGYGGPASGLNAWSGAAFNYASMEFIVAACGGHGSYYGNPVFRFPLSTVQWVFAKETGTFINGPVDGLHDMDPPGPTAHHEYSGIQALDEFNLVICGGDGSNNLNGDNPWFYNETTNEYERCPFTVAFNLINCWLPDTKRLMLLTPDSSNYNRGRMIMYDPATKMITSDDQILADMRNEYTTGAYSTKDKKLITFINGLMRIYDVVAKTVQGYSLTQAAVDWAGKTGHLAQYPARLAPNPDDVITMAAGLDYCPDDDCFYSWSGGADVIKFSLPDFTFTRLMPAAGSFVPPAIPASETQNGVLGKWRWVDAWKSFVGFNSAYNNVVAYKPALA